MEEDYTNHKMRRIDVLKKQSELLKEIDSLVEKNDLKKET